MLLSCFLWVAYTLKNIFVYSYLIFPSTLRGRECGLPQHTDGKTEAQRGELASLRKSKSLNPSRALSCVLASDIEDLEFGQQAYL